MTSLPPQTPNRRGAARDESSSATLTPSGNVSNKGALQLRALEQQLEIAMKQVESTKRLYQKLHEHNDDMETEFLRLKGVLEAVRTRVYFGVRHEIINVRAEARALRELVVNQTSTFQRELGALERVLHSVVQSGTGGGSDSALGGGNHNRRLMEEAAVLFSGAGRVERRRAPAALQDNPLLQMAEDAIRNHTRELSESSGGRQRPQRRRANTVSAQSRREGHSGTTRHDSSAHESSIEFFSDAEGTAATTAIPLQPLAGGVGPSPKISGSGRSGDNAPPLINVQTAAQAAELAKQRSVAERQAKQIEALTSDLQFLHGEKQSMQQKLAQQEEQFHQYLKQMKEMHKEQEATLRSQLDMMSQVAMARASAAHIQQQNNNNNNNSPSSSTRRPGDDQLFQSRSNATVKSDYASTGGNSAKRIAKQRQAEDAARALLAKRRSTPGHSPAAGGDVTVSDGLWAQCALEKRAVKALFPSGNTIAHGVKNHSRSSSVNGSQTSVKGVASSSGYTALYRTNR